MMFQGENLFNASFDVYAENYHSVRPGYPKDLFADIGELGKISSESRLLEIGAGSGIATRELAKFGGQVVALEPGENLALIAREQLKGSPNANVVIGTFEDVQDSETYSAILAFTAYHWIDAGIKYQKVHDLLDESGALVLVWNSFFLADDVVTAEVNNAYHVHLPEEYPNQSSVSDVNNQVLAKLHRREQEVVGNNLFYTIALRKYYTVYNYNGLTYPKLLNTFPKIVVVDDEKKQRFFANVSSIVEKHGKISVPVLTTLLVCKKQTDFLHAITNPEKGK